MTDDYQNREEVFIDSYREDDNSLLDVIEEEAYATQVPIIKPAVRDYLRIHIELTKPMRVLEIGAAIGYSALLMSKYLPKGARITTIENYSKRVRIARDNISRMDKNEVITLLDGDAKEIISELNSEYDLIFLDAAKAQYPSLLPDIIRLLKVGGALISDNVLQDGDILESRYAISRRDRTIHSRMREYLYKVTHSGCLSTVILPLGDGISVSIRKL